jgi:hypothetical protein
VRGYVPHFHQKSNGVTDVTAERFDGIAGMGKGGHQPTSILCHGEKRAKFHVMQWARVSRPRACGPKFGFAAPDGSQQGRFNAFGNQQRSRAPSFVPRAGFGIVAQHSRKFGKPHELFPI